MSYNKMMRRMRGRRRTRRYPQYMGSTLLDSNERRRVPWLGREWYEPEKKERLEKFLAEWDKETERLLKENPNLKIV